jgi:hypothetical protein
MPPEKAPTRWRAISRSPDSIRESIEWVRTHDSMKFLESFYFQYGHASIADLGHVVLCFEGISELAATEAEDEQLWDGQARSSRYQDFSRSGFVTPPELSGRRGRVFERGEEAARGVRRRFTSADAEFLSRAPAAPGNDEAGRLRAQHRRAGVRRRPLHLFFGIPTGVGQVTSIRTLERQIRRLKASPNTPKCANSPGKSRPPARASRVPWDGNCRRAARAHARAARRSRRARQQSRSDLRVWAKQNLGFVGGNTRGSQST